ncbi:MAG TPA: ATP-binding cassette domain-containing protein [Steroidobacteraceae bacterium]|jgi:ABC-2 type transport system ATP-binding protein|nr:ATP-binding cassette domain-containing protein [Steroidobacteraceae bacterium]
MTAVLELQDVRKSFGDKIAIESLDLAIPQGATYGLIGPSGAGKTTAIRMIMSILFPDRGRISVLGQASALDAKDRIGYLPEERGSYRKMTVGAFLTYMGCLKGRTRAQAFGRADRLLGRLGLPDVATKKCEDLSKGMLQRVQFVAAIVNEPDLLILDEPFSGLDPLSVRLLKEVIAEEHQRGATIIFSTHVMAHAEELCQQIVMIHQGRKVLDEPISGLRRQYDTRRVQLEPLDPDANLLALQTVPGVESLKLNNEGCELRLVAGTDPGAAIRAIATVVAPARIELVRIRLEDVFIRLVSQSGATENSTEALRTHLQGLSQTGVAT